MSIRVSLIATVVIARVKRHGLPLVFGFTSLCIYLCYRSYTKTPPLHLPLPPGFTYRGGVALSTGLSYIPDYTAHSSDISSDNPGSTTRWSPVIIPSKSIPFLLIMVPRILIVPNQLLSTLVILPLILLFSACIDQCPTKQGSHKGNYTKNRSECDNNYLLIMCCSISGAWT